VLISKNISILVTGASGFIGSHTIERLVGIGCTVAILKRPNSDFSRIKHLLHKVKIFSTEDGLEIVFQNFRVDYVLHLATLYKKFDATGDVEDMIEANISFPVKLLELGIRSDLKGFINTGTFFEYDCSILPVNESAQILPYNFYAKTKLAFESILKSYSNRLNINTFRLFSPYGERDNYKLIPMIIQKALSKETIKLSDGIQKLDFIYVLDIVDAYIKALEEMSQLNQVGSYSMFNLGNGIPISVREIVSVIEQHLGESLDVVWGDPSVLDIPVVYADISKIKRELSWQPSYSIHQGIAKTIEFYRKKDI